MKRRDILLQAADLTEGVRDQEYGSWEENAMAIAGIWSAIIGHKVEPRHVALCMVGLKLVRLKHQPHADSWVDIAGYAGLGGECDSVER